MKNKRLPVLFLFAVLFAACLFAFSGCAGEVYQNNLYTIQLDFNAEEGKASCSMEFDYVNNSDMPQSMLKFHLYPNAFREGAKYPAADPSEFIITEKGIIYGGIDIVSVKNDGQESGYVIDGLDYDILTVPINETYPGEKTSVSIEFNLKLPAIRHRFGTAEYSVNFGNWYPVLCASDENGWDITPYLDYGDPFCGETADYKVSVTCPAEYVAAGSGEKDFRTEGGKNHTEYELENIRDFALAFSKHYKKLTDSGKYNISYYYYNDRNPGLSLETAVKAVNTFEAFGKYRYPCFTVAQTGFSEGGMEYGAMVTVTDTLDSETTQYVIVHETAHQWWYNMVGNDQVREAFLDEGLTEFSTAYFFELHNEYGSSMDDITYNAKTNMEAYARLAEKYYGEACFDFRRPLNEYKNPYDYSFSCYTNAMLMFCEAYKEIGREAFIKALNNYYENNLFRRATVYELCCSFENYIDLNALISKYCDFDKNAV